MKTKGRNMIVSSLILGIISIVLSIFAWAGVWWIAIISLALGILGIIFSSVGQSRYGGRTGTSIGGLVTSIIGVVISSGALLLIGSAYAAAIRIAAR